MALMQRLFWLGRIKHYLCWSSWFAYFHGGHTLCSHSDLATQGVKIILEKWANGCSIVVGEASISVVSLACVSLACVVLSDEISCLFYDLVQYIYYILVL